MQIPEIPTNKKSIYMRKLKYGVGTNDADYQVSVVLSGRRVLCPVYSRWHDMLRRCYSPEYQSKFPTYFGCSVCAEWLSFMSFRAWIISQDFIGKEVDKDIKITGNKIYSPESCLLVTNSINSLLNTSPKRRGAYPIGVHFDKRSNKFKAQCNVDGVRKFVGSCLTVGEASRAYNNFKSSHVINVAAQQSQPLKGYLLRIANEIARGELNIKDL